MREVKSNRGRKPACVVLAVVYTLAMIAFSGMLIWLNMLPVKYLIPLIAVILAGSFLVDAFLFIRKPKSRRRTAAVIISLLLIAVYGVGMYYIYSTQDLFAKISTIGRETEEYYLIVRKDDDIEKALDKVDKELLVKALGIPMEWCVEARNTWKTLQARRLNRGEKI